jgi:hypothetical protein
MGCNSNKNEVTKIKDSSETNELLFYFGVYSRFDKIYNALDTFRFEKKIFHDTLMTFTYGIYEDSSYRLLDKISFEVKNNQVVGIDREYLEEVQVDSVFVVNHYGDSILLLECQPIIPAIDGDGIHIISLDFGLILSYSRSWRNYYHVTHTSNDEVTRKIQELQRLYFLTKAKI